MPKTTIKIKTWKCEDCVYYQDFNPNNAELMDKVFKGYPLGICPSCYPQHSHNLVEVDEADRVTIVLLGEEDVDAMDISEEEKTAMKAQIQADIIKYQAMQ